MRVSGGGRLELGGLPWHHVQERTSSLLVSSIYMAKIFPDIEVIKRSKQKPTEGELHLINYLISNFGDDVEIYVQSCFNGDRPDIVLMSAVLGVIIIEVKDWNLDLYEIDRKNNWHLKVNGSLIKSPFQQVFSYKKSFFDIHVNGLFEKSIRNKAFYKIIKTYVYFHKGSKVAIDSLFAKNLEDARAELRTIAESFKSKAIDFAEYESKSQITARRLEKYSRDMSISLHGGNLRKIKFPLNGNERTFDEGVYREFQRLLTPPLHYASEGKDFNYSAKQLRLITSKAGDRLKICGIAGSGKTVVLAGRAVNAHKRHGERVLILSFNITLSSYIRDKISAVRSDFSWSAFDISTYHRFITSALNNAGIMVIVPDHLNYDGPDRITARNVSLELDAYLEKEYYTNFGIFENANIEYKYDTILIDEIQDYKPEWIKIIRAMFLEENGEMILFGDEKQNIYKRSLDAERRSKVVEGFGKWEKLTKSFRYFKQSPVLPLIDAFQRRYLSDSYELDEDESFQLALTNIGIQGYQIFENSDLANLARQIVSLAKASQIHPNDITIVSSNDLTLAELDYHIRKGEGHRERTLCSFPSREVTTHPKYSAHYRKISAIKKKAFNLNSGVMKLTSTHSFKGFESPYVALLVNAKDSAEMVYTGLTRARQNVLVFLDRDCPYIDFFESHLNRLQLGLFPHS